MPGFTSQIWEKLRAFGRASAGNVVVTFAIASVPVIGAVGAAVDFSHANSVKADLQASLDSTVLMLSRDAANLSNAELQVKALAYFQAVFTRPEAKIVTVSASYSNSGGASLVVNGSVSVPTTLIEVLGIKTLTVGGSSTAKWGTDRLRVALVLDNTGSMASAGKMDALKTATKNLLSQLKGAALVDGDVYVSIVPFVKDVNADPGNKGKNWIDWTEWDKKNGACKNYLGTTVPTDQDACVTASGKWNSANHNTWNGCVADRGGYKAPSLLNTDTDVSKTKKKNPETLYPAEQYAACPQPVSGLSYDWAGMDKLVDNMAPNGNTNQAIGLVWGWLSLAGGGPFTVPKEDSGYKYQEIIILLTDGLNTQDRWYSDAASIDARQKMTCANIKAANITLYTIQVNTDGDPTSTLLQECASSADKFFLLTSAGGIIAAFDAIASKLTKLHVAK